MFDKFGRTTGYGQIAPGRDLPVTNQVGEQEDDEQKRQREIISGAIGGMPIGGIAPFAGAANSIGARAHTAGPAFPNTGVAGGKDRGMPVASGAALGPSSPTSFGDKIPAQTLYATTQEQNDAIQRRQSEVNARNSAAFQHDTERLKSYNGNVPSDFRPTANENLDISDILGAGAVNLANPMATPTATAGAAPAATPATPDYSRLNGGYSLDKLNDPNKQSAKYVMGRTLAGFDPTKGITPEVVDALNKLGYGTFSGANDKLSLSGLTEAGKKAGLVGDYQNADFNEGFHTGQGKWSYQDPAYESMHPEESRGPVGPGMNPLAIQNAITGNVPDEDPNTYAARIRAQVMAALQSQPGLASLGKMFGV